MSEIVLDRENVTDNTNMRSTIRNPFLMMKPMFSAIHYEKCNVVQLNGKKPEVENRRSRSLNVKYAYMSL